MKINYQYQTKKRIYELTDHLGNVRAVIKREKDANNRAQIIKASDYYPFGMEMPGRKYASESYRYDYQGQFAEKDGETGLHSFELRQWDARIARWNSTDPYGQHFSPYMGMGNNPVSLVDPNGGISVSQGLFIGAGVGAIVGGLVATITGEENVWPYFVAAGMLVGAGTQINFSGLSLPPLPEFNPQRLVGPALYSVINAVGAKPLNVAYDGRGVVYERTTTTDLSTIGSFSIPGTDINGYFLEPPGPSTATPNQNRRIPEGIYNVEPFSGEKFKNVYRLYNSQVSRSRNILIHRGSNPEDTKGCLLPGNNFATNFVNGSRDMFKILKARNINKIMILNP
jgi:RHS repeat-associated protein